MISSAQQFNVASPGQIHAAQLNEASHNENSLEGHHFQEEGEWEGTFNLPSQEHSYESWHSLPVSAPATYSPQQNQQGNTSPGSYQYIYNDFSHTQSSVPKAENQFSVTHQQDFPYQLQQSILGDKLAVGSENIKIYVPENYVS